MNQSITFQINYKEHLYFAIKAVISVIIYVLFVFGIVTLIISDTLPTDYLYLGGLFLVMFTLSLFIQFGLLIGYLRGNAVKVSAFQFPDIYELVHKQSQQLGLSAVPDVYILQSGGLLNAFVAHFLGSNYIVLYSDVVEAAYEEDKKLLDFIIGHELGHIKRKHFSKKLLLFPSSFIPLLGLAYSRACEYTCDNIGHALCPEGARNGLMLIASGKKLFKNVNVGEYVKQGQIEGGFWNWVSEKVSTHPHLTKRIGKFKDAHNEKVRLTKVDENTVIEKPVTDDHSKYMPKM
jgi:Zn-dependent protease with chaperone function